MRGLLDQAPIAPKPGADVEARLLYTAYTRKPLNLLMTAGVTALIAVLLWRVFPAAEMSLWTVAILFGVALGYFECAAFRRAAPQAQQVAHWKWIFLLQSTLAGLTWSLGPCLLIHHASGVELTLLVAILLAVCTVAMISMAEQRTAMMAFVSAVASPPALVLWWGGGERQGMVGLALVCGMVLMIFVGRRLNQTMRDLMENQGRTRAIVDTALDAIIEMNARGLITDWNRRAEIIFGWSRSEAIGLVLDETIIAQQHRAAFRGGIDGMASSRTEYILNRRTERTAMRRDGTEFPVEMTVTPMQTGVVWHFTVFIEDITERKLADAKVKESEERYRTLIEWSPEAITVHSSGKLVFANPAAVKLFGGHHEQDLLGKPILDLIHADFREAISNRIRGITVSGGSAPMIEVKYLRLDGGAVDVEVQAKFITYDGMPAVLGVMRNITERKQAEEAQRIAATAFESQQGMFITNAQRVILRVNRAFTEITGYKADEVVGRSPRLLSSGRHDSAFYAAMWTEIERDGSWQGELWNRRKSGELFPEWLTISAVKDSAGLTTHYVAAFTDITSRKSAEDQIQNLAFYDPLTGLPNRRLLLDRMEQTLTSSTRRQRKSALLFIDLDNFKTINDTLGHFQGDLLLEQVATRLVGCVREGDTVARLGSDEFVVMLEGLSFSEVEAATQARGVSAKIVAALNRPYELAHGEHHNTPSMGVALFGADPQESSDAPLKRAELAMFQAKDGGGNGVRFFDPQMQVEVMSRAAMEADLREAVLTGQFLLHYQAQVVGAGRLTGVEALLRWRHPQRGLVSPLEFITLAEETGLIIPMGQWVLESACRQLAIWSTQPSMAQLSVAVNVSARQFQHKDFVATVQSALADAGASPRRLKLELTESLMVKDVESIITKMNTLKAMGVNFSLDDFGTGYSSLSYLKRLPLDQLKIDQGFVRNVLTDPNDAAIAKMVIALADSLGLTVIAEGVEIEAQRDFLAHLGCHNYQGYLFSRPLPIEEFEAFARAATLQP